MNEAYKKELVDLKYKMQKAEKFAKVLPVFYEKILGDKISGDELYVRFGKNYKGLYCAWGINRGVFETGTTRTVTNYRDEPYKEYLFSIYINTLSMYDSHEKFGLDEIADDVPVFFYDAINSNFYATDSQIEVLLDALVSWYENARKQIIEVRKEKEIEELKEKLNKLTTTND